MRGGYIHNRVLVEPIVQKVLCIPGARVDQEVAIRVGDQFLYGDLLIQVGSQRILVEAELTAKRIENDLLKAAAMEPCELWVVVPNPLVKKAIQRKLSRQPIPMASVKIFVLLLPQTLQRVTEFSELISGSNDGRKKGKTIQSEELGVVASTDIRQGNS